MSTDLGAGVHHHPEPAVTTAPTDWLTCPWCGLHDRAGQVDHPNGIFLCACGSLFNGTDPEWRRLTLHRDRATTRRNTDPHKEDA